MDAVENCLRAINNYNIDTATRTGNPNAFSYFTPFDGKTRQTDALSTYNKSRVFSFYAFRKKKKSRQIDVVDHLYHNYPKLIKLWLKNHE